MIDPSSVHPGRLVQALVAAGWNPAGRRAGAYVRLTWPGDDRRHLLVPLDAANGDYDDLMGAVLAELDDAASTGRAAQQVLADLAGEDVV